MYPTRRSVGVSASMTVGSSKKRRFSRFVNIGPRRCRKPRNPFRPVSPSGCSPVQSRRTLTPPSAGGPRLGRQAYWLFLILFQPCPPATCFSRSSLSSLSTSLPVLTGQSGAGGFACGADAFLVSSVECCRCLPVMDVASSLSGRARAWISALSTMNIAHQSLIPGPRLRRDDGDAL